MRGRIKAAVLTFAIFGCLTGILLLGMSYFEQINESESKQLLERSVRNAVVECYAVEGVYPSDLEYLEKWYGIKFDKEKYSIDYSYYSTNIVPDIVVHEKRGSVND